MFQVGDAVVHPVNGAGFVAKLHSMPGFDEEKPCYKIEILGRTKTTLMVPVERAEEVGLRRAITVPHLDRVWDVLRGEPEALPDNHKTRYKQMEDKLHTGEVLQIAEVVRDMAWRQRQADHLNVPGRRIYLRGMELLISELAVAQTIEIEAAELQVEKLLKKSFDRLEEFMDQEA